jgi:hypothetical protein
MSTEPGSAESSPSGGDGRRRDVVAAMQSLGVAAVAAATVIHDVGATAPTEVTGAVAVVCYVGAAVFEFFRSRS